MLSINEKQLRMAIRGSGAGWSGIAEWGDDPGRLDGSVDYSVTVKPCGRALRSVVLVRYYRHLFHGRTSERVLCSVPRSAEGYCKAAEAIESAYFETVEGVSHG